MAQKLTINGLPLSYEVALSLDSNLDNAGPFQSSPYFYTDPAGNAFVNDRDYYAFPRDPLTPDLPVIGQRVRYHEDTPGSGTVTLQIATDNGNTTTQPITAQKFIGSNHPIIDLTKAGETIGGIDANGTVSRLALENLKRALDLLNQAAVCISSCCLPEPTATRPTCADFGPFAWVVGTPVGVQLPDWQNGTGQLPTGLPAGLSAYQTSEGNHFAFNGTPTAVGSGTITYLGTGADGAIVSKTCTYTVSPAPITPLNLEAPDYVCDGANAGKLTFHTTGGDGTTKQYYIPGILAKSVVDFVVIQEDVRNNTNAQPLEITVYQGVGANAVTDTVLFDFRAHCANNAPLVQAPSVPAQTAIVGVGFSYTFPPFTLNGVALVGAVYSVSKTADGLTFDPNTRTLLGNATMPDGFPFDYTALYQGRRSSVANISMLVRSPALPTVQEIDSEIIQPGSNRQAFLYVKLSTPTGAAQIRLKYDGFSAAGGSTAGFSPWADASTYLNGFIQIFLISGSAGAKPTGIDNTVIEVEVKPKDNSGTSATVALTINTGTANYVRRAEYQASASLSGNQPPADDGPADSSLAGTDYRGTAITTTTAPNNLTA